MTKSLGTDPRRTCYFECGHDRFIYECKKPEKIGMAVHCAAERGKEEKRKGGAS
jgi:hypothetical protein